MASRRIEDLHPLLQPLAEQFKTKADAQGIDFIFTCTYRSAGEQNALYAQGRTAPGRIVTNAKAGQSRHNTTLNGKPASEAFDIVPMVNGKPCWDAKHPAWQTLGAIGESLGLEWAARWKTFKEFPHFQLKR